MGSSNPPQVRQGYNPAMMQQPQMGYPNYGNPMPMYSRYQGMPMQSTGLPQIPYRQGVNYPQQMMYNSTPPMYQNPVEYSQPNMVSYSPSRPFEMANYAIPQRASYIAPVQSQMPMIRDDSALLAPSSQPQPLVRRSLTPPPVMRSQISGFPEPNAYFNPTNIQPGAMISQPPPPSEMFTQQSIAPMTLQSAGQPIQITGENYMQQNAMLPTMDYANYGATLPATYQNYPQYLSGASYQNGLYSNNLQQPQAIYSGNVPSNFMIPNQPYQLPMLNQQIQTTGMIQNEFPGQIQASPPQVSMMPRQLN